MTSKQFKQVRRWFREGVLQEKKPWLGWVRAGEGDDVCISSTESFSHYRRKPTVRKKRLTSLKKMI
jgi:hypothetical protein